MSTATPQEPNSNGSSRLDQEIDEILSRSGADELKPPPAATRKQPRSIPGGQVARARAGWKRPSSAGFWMIGALAIAFLAVLVSDASPLLARLLVFAAVISFIVPILSRFRRTSAPPEMRMWRGQVMDVTPARTNPIDQVRDWWRNRTGQ